MTMMVLIMMSELTMRRRDNSTVIAATQSSSMQRSAAATSPNTNTNRTGPFLHRHDISASGHDTEFFGFSSSEPARSKNTNNEQMRTHKR
mmetsp:Transcript_24396/g.68556  ORF Transcript_24396/g.68556 Transcript_24396/m.68556 type:complete len:90 (+) Transcript_24396:174-443(+)